MRFSEAIDLYLVDMRSSGRIGSAGSERAYRDVLILHGADCDYRDPRQTVREDAKRTLRRWTNPNTARTRRSILLSFYDWLVEEGYRRDNPARQTRRPKTRPAQVKRLTQGEVVELLQAARGIRERRAIFVGVCAGLRSQELRGLQGRHFRRENWIWVSSDIGKGGRERQIPVISDLRDVVAEVRQNVADKQFVLPAQKWADPGNNRDFIDYPLKPCSHQALGRLVNRVGRRAGFYAHPHMLRRAFADYVARQAGVFIAQALLGHADLSTTEDYLSDLTPDELAAAVKDLTFGLGGHPVKRPANPLIARRGFEPLSGSSRTPERYRDALTMFLPGTLAIGRPCGV